MQGAFATGNGVLSGLVSTDTVVGTMWYKVSGVTTGTVGTATTVGTVTKFTVTFLSGGAVTYTAGTAGASRTFSINRGSAASPVVPYINQTVAGYNDYTSGDLFNQSIAYRRNLLGLVTSSVEINNVPLTSVKTCGSIQRDTYRSWKYKS